MCNLSALAVALSALLLMSGAAAHAAACENPAALGVSRTLKVDSATLPKIGIMSYRDSLPLDDHEIVITFDDGPVPRYTEKILDILAAHCVGATFFMVGRMAMAHPESVRKVAAAGHTIGTHSQDHPWFTRLSPAKAKDEIDQGFASVQAALGRDYEVAPFFRFPGLLHSAGAEAYLAERGVMVWSVDFHGDDWYHRISPEEIVKRVMNRLAGNHNRGVLLLHDIHARTAAALPSLLARLKEQGFKVVHVVPATELKPVPSLVASASPDGSGLSAAAIDPAAARSAGPATAAAASVSAGADADRDAAAPKTAKTAPVLADHLPSASSLRKRLVQRNNNKVAFAHRPAVAHTNQGTRARLAAAHAHHLAPIRAAAVARLTRAHAIVTPRRQHH